MTAIIKEGPDESGNTTLATALFGHYGEDAFYLKSPAGKSSEWYPYFDAWVGRVIGDTRTGIQILDRIPEISEMVYGPIMRNGSRLNNPIASILNLPRGSVVIFCHAPEGLLKGEHYAAGAKLLRPEDQGAIIGGYKVIESLVKESGVQVLHWYYWRTEELWKSLLTQLALRSNEPGFFENAWAKGRDKLHESA